MALAPTRDWSLDGFELGVGDLAALAGAGRNVFTWVNNAWGDRSLLEILGLDSDQIISRRGLFLPGDLEKRWSQKATILRQGEVVTLQLRENKHVKLPRLDGFSWFMTLVTAALSAALMESSAQQVIINFLFEICENDGKTDYVLRAIQKHISGWRSAATVRHISEYANQAWHQLEIQGVHQPGLAPAADSKEFEIFLIWLSGHSDDLDEKELEAAGFASNRYELHTASSDVWSLASMLRDMGMGLQVARGKGGFDEGVPVVILDPDMVVHRGSRPSRKRRGMRVSLTNMDEAISLWPGSRKANARRRNIFVDGMEAAQHLEIRAGQLETGTVISHRDYEPLLAVLHTAPGRGMTDETHRLASEFLLGVDAAAASKLERLVDSWNLDLTRIREVADSLAGLDPKGIPSNVLAEFQIFILGYYYGATSSLLDTSRLLVQEAFGSWTWDDLEFCSLLKSIRTAAAEAQELEGSKTIRYYKKADMLKIISYLYAAAETKQIRAIGRSSCGLSAKLTILDATMMGSADAAGKIRGFCLLDIDRTCFPSSSLGIMTSATPVVTSFETVQPQHTLPLSSMRTPASTPDFTSLIEPDWDHDVQASVVTFRNKGRLVYRASPGSIFSAVFSCFPVSDEYFGSGGIYRYSLFATSPPPPRPEDTHGTPTSGSETGTNTDIVVHRMELQSLEGGVRRLFLPDPTHTAPFARSSPMCVATANLPKARACIASMYSSGDAEGHRLATLRGRPASCSATTMVANSEDFQVLLL